MIKNKITENATLKWRKSRKIAGKVEILAGLDRCQSDRGSAGQAALLVVRGAGGLRGDITRGVIGGAYAAPLGMA
jgi:hypothetical protein